MRIHKFGIIKTMETRFYQTKNIMETAQMCKAIDLPLFFSLTLKWSVKTEKLLGYLLRGIASGHLLRLQILDLENGYETPFPNNIGELIHLLYLNWRRTLIKEIPPSILNLKNLQILDLMHTFIPAFHIPIQKVRNCRNLRTYS